MELVATFIAADPKILTSEFLHDVVDHSLKIGVQDMRTSWLDDEFAVDIFGAGLIGDSWRRALKSVIGNRPVDVIVQPVTGRRKKLLAADMESTIIQQELLDELAGEIGVRSRVAHITQRAMNGEIDFIAALRGRVALLDGQPVSLLDKVAQGITIMPGAVSLVAVMKANGARTWLITGGFSYFADPVAQKLGFDQAYANELVINNGVITGEAKEPILDRIRKKVLLQQACEDLRISLAACVCVGDGANDVPMLLACHEGGGLGIAYRAKPAVRDQIPNQINHADLTALLYAQGYRRDEITPAAS
jgi:phosphoserine phosphatase